jgi:hypothetical protein
MDEDPPDLELLRRTLTYVQRFGALTGRSIVRDCAESTQDGIRPEEHAWLQLPETPAHPDRTAVQMLFTHRAHLARMMAETIGEDLVKL